MIVSATTLYYTTYIVKCDLHSEITYHYSYRYLVRNSWVVCNQFLMLIINVHMHVCMQCKLQASTVTCCNPTACIIPCHSQPFLPLPPVYISHHTCVTIKDATNNRKLCRGDSLFKALYSDKWSYSYLSQGCAFKFGPCVHSCLATCDHDTCTSFCNVFLGCCCFDIV